MFHCKTNDLMQMACLGCDPSNRSSSRLRGGHVSTHRNRRDRRIARQEHRSDRCRARRRAHRHGPSTSGAHVRTRPGSIAYRVLGLAPARVLTFHLDCLRKCSIRMSASRHVDDICHGQSLSASLAGYGLWSEVTIRTWADDAGIPRWRIARRKRVREDLVQRPFGRKARVTIADLVNDAVSYNGRHHRCDGGLDIRLRFLCEA